MPTRRRPRRRRRNRRTTAANRAIAQCRSHRLAPERITAGNAGPMSKPGRWVLALILPLQDRLRPSDGALFRANDRKVPIGREVHATLTPLKLNRILLIPCRLFRGSALRCRHGLVRSVCLTMTSARRTCRAH